MDTRRSSRPLEFIKTSVKVPILRVELMQHSARWRFLQSPAQLGCKSAWILRSVAIYLAEESDNRWCVSHICQTLPSGMSNSCRENQVQFACLGGSLSSRVFFSGRDISNEVEQTFKRKDGISSSLSCEYK